MARVSGERESLVVRLQELAQSHASLQQLYRSSLLENEELRDALTKLVQVRDSLQDAHAELIESRIYMAQEIRSLKDKQGEMQAVVCA